MFYFSFSRCKGTKTAAIIGELLLSFFVMEIENVEVAVFSASYFDIFNLLFPTMADFLKSTVICINHLVVTEVDIVPCYTSKLT